jgi:hypothetical protein
VQDAASLRADSPQTGVVKSDYLTAVGRLVARATWQSSLRIEYATYSQDTLGHLSSMTRYHDADTGTKPVPLTWRTDSLGQVIAMQEPQTAPQARAYSSWRELLDSSWTTSATSSTHLTQRYDALGRLVHTDQQHDGVVIPDTINDYQYTSR